MCYFEDEETGEYLGQDVQSALGGSTLFPESLKKELESIRQLVTPKKIDPEITKRADQIKEKFFIDTVERSVKESLRDILDEVKDVIEDKKFNRKVKSEILDKLNRLTGDKDGS